MGKICKLSIISMLMILSVFIASAQNSPFTLGIKTGLNLSNTSVDLNSMDKKAKIGFQVGVTAEYALSKAFFLQSGLTFTIKGGEAKGNINITNIVEGSAKIILTQTYLQIPVMAVYKVNVAHNTKIVFGAGPYLAYGVGGKTKFKGDINIPILDTHIGNMDFDTFGDDILKPFDFGLGAGVGAEFGSITVGINYELGLVDISKDFKELEMLVKKLEYKNHNASLTIGYRF